jgi:hypothetical protein
VASNAAPTGKRNLLENLLSDEVNQNATRLTAANGNSATVDGTFDRIAQRCSTQILHPFTWDEPHLSEAGCDPVGSINPNNVGFLPRLKLVEGGAQ